MQCILWCVILDQISTLHLQSIDPFKQYSVGYFTNLRPTPVTSTTNNLQHQHLHPWILSMIHSLILISSSMNIINYLQMTTQFPRVGNSNTFNVTSTELLLIRTVQTRLSIIPQVPNNNLDYPIEDVLILDSILFIKFSWHLDNSTTNWAPTMLFGWFFQSTILFLKTFTVV